MNQQPPSKGEDYSKEKTTNFQEYGPYMQDLMAL